MTAIYGLYDPRNPDMVMYVGKGMEKRARSHWRGFLQKGTAVNVLLRKWFERLKAENTEPAWRFLEENVINWQERERSLISTWRVMNLVLCNVASGGNSWPLESSRIGGLIGGRSNAINKTGVCGQSKNKMSDNGRKAGLIGGRSNAINKTGFCGRSKDKMSEDGRKAGKIGGPIGGRRVQELHPETGRILGLKYGSKGGHRTKELHPELAGENGRKYGSKGGCLRYGLHPEQARENNRVGNHVRWHVKRNLKNSSCVLCNDAVDKMD